MYRLAIQDLLHDSLRSFFNLLGMSLVIFGALLLNALGGSLQDLLAQDPISQNLMVVDATFIDPSDSNIPLSIRQSAEELVPAVFQRVSPVFFRHLQIGERVTQVRAAPVSDFAPVHHLQLVEGRFPAGPREAVVGEGAASANAWKIGARLGINSAEFTVTGIYRAAGTSFSAIWIPFDTAMDLFGADRSTQGLVLQLAQGVDSETARQVMQNKLKSQSGEFSIFYEDAYTRRNSRFALDMMLLMNVVSLVSLLSICLGSFSTSALFLAERTRQIGILRALGFSSVSIRIFGLFRTVLLSGGAFCLAAFAGWVYITLIQSQGQISVLGVPLRMALSPGWAIVYGGLTLGFALAGAWIAMRRSFDVPVFGMVQD